MKMKKWNIPKIHLGWRILIYILMLAFAALALIQAAANIFSFWIGIIWYVLSALTFFCGIYYLIFDIKNGIDTLKHIADEKVTNSEYANQVIKDDRLKTMYLALPGIITSALFAVFHGITGIVSESLWYGCLSAYYLLLGIMRIGAVAQEKKIRTMECESARLQQENKIYRRNSMLFILLAFILCGMVILLGNSIGGKEYPGVTIYVVALYTFYRIILSFIHMAKDRKKNSPFITIVLKIDYIDAWVAVLILQTAMFAAFGDDDESFIRIMNVITGTIVCLNMLIAGIQGIYVSSKRNVKEKET